MDKNTITGILLIVLVLIGFSWWSQPSQEEINAYQRQQDSIASAVEMQKALEIQARAQAEKDLRTLAADSAGVFFEARSAEPQIFTLENQYVAIDISTRGGLPQKAVMKKYDSWNNDSSKVVLFDGKDVGFNFTFDGKQENIATKDLTFRLIGKTDTTAVLRLDAAGYGHIDLNYSLCHDAYMLNLSVSSQEMQNFFSSSLKTMGIEWVMHARQQEKGYDFENRYSSITYKKAGRGTDYLSETSEEEETLEDPLDWVAFKNQFFSCVMIAAQDFKSATLKSVPEQDKKSGYIKHYEASMQTSFDTTGATPTQLQFYFGPNDFHLLQTHNTLSIGKKELDLEELVYLGWPLFRWINRWIILNLFDLLRGWGLHMGLVLLLITLIMKVLVYPATRKSFLSSARMRVLKPKVDEINARYPNQADALKKQQEVMALYSQYGVSPMGGCLPMLIQTPIWIALFNFVPNAIQLRGESFLWADDLSAYDELINWGTDLWLIGDHLSIFCLLFCATNIINTIISMRQQQNSVMSAEQEQSMKMMRWMMYLMPVMFFFMFNNYSSGLNYYYFLSGLTSILMMWYLRKTTDDTKLLAQLEERFRERKAKGQGQGGGAFNSMTNMANRLQELQRLQEEQRRQRQSGK